MRKTFIKTVKKKNVIDCFGYDAEKFSRLQADFTINMIRESIKTDKTTVEILREYLKTKDYKMYSLPKEEEIDGDSFLVGFLFGQTLAIRDTTNKDIETFMVNKLSLFERIQYEITRFLMSIGVLRIEEK